MACFNPLEGFRGKYPNPQTGKFPMVFSRRDAAEPDSVIKLPCGRCIGCRLERSRQWALRCVHEASLYDRNCFITLTYAPEHLPPSGSLSKKTFQDFMKRLRQHQVREWRKTFKAMHPHLPIPKLPESERIRYFHCGEYGEKRGRPHYHASLFNYDFKDRVYWKTVNGFHYYKSATLEKIWGLGFVTVCDFSFETAAYVARYITKKITGPPAEGVYGDVIEWTKSHHVDGDPKQVWKPTRYRLLQEYCTMSRRPGIGAKYYEKYKGDFYPLDRVILRGRAMRPPKFYDSLFELDDPVRFEEVKDARNRKSVLVAKDNEPSRLRAREKHQNQTFRRLKRGYEDG